MADAYEDALRDMPAMAIWAERTASTKRVRNAFVCRIGKDIMIANDVLEAAAAKHLSWASIDLLTIAAVVALADRQLSRHRGKVWGRRFVLYIPVYDLQVWTSAKTGLQLTLSYLTGDNWTVVFRHETQPFKPRLRRQSKTRNCDCGKTTRAIYGHAS